MKHGHMRGCKRMITKKCSKPFCKNKVPARQKTPYCEEHKPKQQKQYDEKTRKFYNSTTWRKLRQTVNMKYHGLCAECLEHDDVVKGDVVHHIIEIKQDWEKRFDIDNLILLCHACHAKKHTEKGGRKYE